MKIFFCVPPTFLPRCPAFYQIIIIAFTKLFVFGCTNHVQMCEKIGYAGCSEQPIGSLYHKNIYEWLDDLKSAGHRAAMSRAMSREAPRCPAQKVFYHL